MYSRVTVRLCCNSTSDSPCNPYNISTFISVLHHINIEDFLLFNYFEVSAFVSLLVNIRLTRLLFIARIDDVLPSQHKIHKDIPFKTLSSFRSLRFYRPHCAVSSKYS